MSPEELGWGIATREVSADPFKNFLGQWGLAQGHLSDWGKIAVTAARRLDEPEILGNLSNAMVGFWDRFNLSAAFYEVMRNPAEDMKHTLNLARLIEQNHPALQTQIVGKAARHDGIEMMVGYIHAVAQYSGRADIARGIEHYATLHNVSVGEERVAYDQISGAQPPLTPAQRQVLPPAEEGHAKMEASGGFKGRPAQAPLSEQPVLATMEEYMARTADPAQMAPGIGTRTGGVTGIRASWLSNLGGTTQHHGGVEGRETLSDASALGRLNRNPNGSGGGPKPEDVTDGPMKVGVIANASPLTRGKIPSRKKVTGLTITGEG